MTQELNTVAVWVFLLIDFTSLFSCDRKHFLPVIVFCQQLETASVGYLSLGVLLQKLNKGNVTWMGSRYVYPLRFITFI